MGGLIKLTVIRLYNIQNYDTVYILNNSANIKMSNNHEITQQRIHDLIIDGAVPIDKAFSVANADQADLVYRDVRLLLTPNDDEYVQYTATLEAAQLPYVTNDPVLGNEQVIAGVLPRDARSIPKIMRSIPSDTGLNPNDVFYLLGRSLAKMNQTSNVVPAVASISLKRILILRELGEVMWIPPMAFEAGNEQTQPRIIEQVRDQLYPEFAKFGAVALLESFERGIHV